ncbi:hypothetical protein AB0B31_11105 [Catellatospora citrea]|uniref:hypothetical protein n=1 Tax=Catellatospora citrea TaxID=53366 RepID=UPI0033C25B8A
MHQLPWRLRSIEATNSLGLTRIAVTYADLTILHCHDADILAAQLRLPAYIDALTRGSVDRLPWISTNPHRDVEITIDIQTTTEHPEHIRLQLTLAPHDRSTAEARHVTLTHTTPASCQQLSLARSRPGRRWQQSTGGPSTPVAAPQFVGAIPSTGTGDLPHWTDTAALTLTDTLNSVVIDTTGPIPRPRTRHNVDLDLHHLTSQMRDGAGGAMRWQRHFTDPPRLVLDAHGELTVMVGALAMPLHDASPRTRALVQLAAARAAADSTATRPQLHLVEQPDHHVPGRDLPALIEFMAGWARHRQIVWSTSSDDVLTHLRRHKPAVDIAAYVQTPAGPQEIPMWPGRAMADARQRATGR